jgi:hypothetical protein
MYWPQLLAILKANSHIVCRAHAVPLTCAARGLECVFPI